MATDTLMDVTGSGDAVSILMNADQARALRDYIDGVDIPDMSLNPGVYGLSADDAADFTNVLSVLAAVLGKVYPY